MTPADSTPPLLLSEEQGGLVRLTLNRPSQYNALSEDLLATLAAVFDRLMDSPTVRCVVLAAAGPAFCAGHDLKEMRARPREDYYRDLFRRCSAVMQKIVALPVPVVARVQGLATAAGCQLVATCDLAIASTEARFAVSGINVGLFCATPAVALSRNILAKPAFEMLVTGRFIDAARAKELGLINDAVPPEKLDEAVGSLVQTILSKSPRAIRHGKRLFHKQRELTLTEAYELASDVMACNMMDEETIEGIDAFLEKRTPRGAG